MAEEKPVEVEHTVGRMVEAIAAADVEVRVEMLGAVVRVRLVVIVEEMMTEGRVVSTGAVTSDFAAKAD